MKIKNKNITYLLLIAGLFLLAACSENNSAVSNEDHTQSTQLDSKTPKKTQAANSIDQVETAANDGIDAPLAFSLFDLDGNEVNAEDFRGQWLVLNYWATWCGPCRDEMPELVKFQAENENVQVLGIAYEDANVEKLKSFAEDFAVNYPLLTIDVYNPPGFAEEGGMGLPTTIVYNQQGMRHKKHMGPIDLEGLVGLVTD